MDMGMGRPRSAGTWLMVQLWSSPQSRNVCLCCDGTLAIKVSIETVQGLLVGILQCAPARQVAPGDDHCIALSRQGTSGLGEQALVANLVMAGQ